MNEKEYILKLGRNIKAIREGKGMTQEALADASDMEDSAIRRIEAGRTNPTVKTLWRIATGLGVKMEDLVKTT